MAEPSDRPIDTGLAPRDTGYADLRLPEIAATLAMADAERSHDVAVLGYAEEVASAEARRDLAYELAIARTEQALDRERIGVTRVEREARIEVETVEIEPKR